MRRTREPKYIKPYSAGLFWTLKHEIYDLRRKIGVWWYYKAAKKIYDWIYP